MGGMIAAISDWIIRIPGTNVYIHVFQLTALACVVLLPLAIIACIAVLLYGIARKRGD